MSTKHFQDWELDCRCGCGFLPPQDFQDSLEQLRVAYGKPMRISSGGRCPKYNNSVSTTGLNGPHTKGAVDVLVWGEGAHELTEIATRFGWKGIGWSQKGPKTNRFVHLDRRPYKAVWSY